MWKFSGKSRNYAAQRFSGKQKLRIGQSPQLRRYLRQSFVVAKLKLRCGIRVRKAVLAFLTASRRQASRQINHDTVTQQLTSLDIRPILWRHRLASMTPQSINQYCHTATRPPYRLSNFLWRLYRLQPAAKLNTPAIMWRYRYESTIIMTTQITAQYRNYRIYRETCTAPYSNSFK